MSRHHLLALFLWCLSAPPLHATEIWLAGVDPFVRNVMEPDVAEPGASSDYLDLFRPDAPWKQAAAKTAVFKTSTQWIMNGPDEALSRMFTNLRERHIALAMEGLMIPQLDQCGHGVEGYAAPGTMAAAAQRIQKLGGKLAYLAMDEPLWFGHRYAGPNACHSSLDELARNVVSNVRAVRSIFPQVEIGDIEPIPTSSGQDWSNQILRWAAAYEKAAGETLSFFHADVVWRAGAAVALPPLATRLREHGIKFGIIYNGDSSSASGFDWVERAEERFIEVEADLVPDHAILQTWMLQPAFMLPESKAGTMTNLALRYSRTPSRIAVAERTGTRIAAKLVDAAGAPIADAAISVLQSDGRSGPLTTSRLVGKVPADAQSALIALRINSECNCNGDAEIGIGKLRYQENGSNMTTRTLVGASRDPESPIAQFHAREGQPQMLNTPSFPVNAGRDFEFSANMRGSWTAPQSGYIALIFLGNKSSEVGRRTLPFHDSGTLAYTARSDDRGNFDIESNIRSELKLRYNGSELIRPFELMIKP